MSDSVTMKQALMLDISDLRHQLAAALRERDEARADADEWQNKYATVFVERDEAREQLRIARDKCHQQRMIRLAGDKVYAEMRHEAEEQARLLAMSADREEKLRSKILMQARVYRGEDLKNNSRWSIFNEGRAQALEKLADETWP